MLLREVGYARPGSLAEALELLAADDGARALAGGQTLINVMKARAGSPDALVDLSRIDELKGIELGADGTLEIGAMTTYTEIMESERGARAADPRRGVRADRRRAGAEPRHDRRQRLHERPDEPPAAAARRARRGVHDRGRATATRTVTAEDFFLGVYMTAVGARRAADDDPRARRPRRRLRRRHARRRRHVHRQRRRVARTAALRIALGCVDAVPVVLAARRRPTPTPSAPPSQGANLDPPSDVHASSEYRTHLAEVVAVRAVTPGLKAGADT